MWKGHHYRGFEEYFDVRTTAPTEGQTLVYSSSGRFVPGNVTTGGATSLSWSQITEKPLTFPASSHGHTISQIENLQSALDAKSNTGHSHVIAEVSGLQAALDGKTDTGHTHTLSDISDLSNLTVDWSQVVNVPAAENRVVDISEVIGLQDALDGKSDTGHTHDASEITTGVLPPERGGHGLVFPLNNTGYLKLVQTDPPQFQVVDITDDTGGGNSIVDDLVSFGLGSLGGGLAGWLFGRRPPRAPGLPDIDEDFENLYVGFNKDVFIDGYSYYVDQVPKGYHWTSQQNFEGGFALNAARKSSLGSYIPYIKWNRDETTDLQFRNAGCQLFVYDETTGNSTLRTNLSPGFFETLSSDHASRSTITGSELRFGFLDNGTYVDTCIIGKDAVRLGDTLDYSQLSSSNLELYKEALSVPVVGTRLDRGGLHVYDAFGESSTQLVELSTTNGLVLQKDPLVSSHVSTLTNSSLSVHEANISELSVSQITNSALTVCHLALEGNLSSPNSNVLGSLTVNGTCVLDSLTVSNLATVNELTCTTDVTCDRVLTETILADSLIDTGVGFVLGDASNLDIGYGHTVYGELFVDKTIKPREGRSNVDLGSPGRRFKNVWCEELRASTNSLFLGDNLKLSLDPDGLTQGGFRIQKVTPDPSDPDLYTVDGYEDLVGDKVLAIGGFTTIDQALPAGASVCVGGDIVVNSPGKFIGDGSGITNLNVSASNVSGLENFVQLGASNVNFGTVTATSFVGDGSGLTGIQAGTADWAQITNKPAVAIENTDVQFTSVTATTYNGLNLSLGDINDLDTSGLEANRPVYWDGSTFVTAPEVIDWTSPTLEVQVNPQPFSTAGSVDLGYPRSLWLGENVMVVGARYEDPSSYNEGRAYIYEVNGGSWTLVQGIPGDSYSEEFGTCCVCSDDGNWVAIGAPRYNGTQGDVRIFERVGGSYVHRQTFTGVGTFNEFGHRVVMNAAGTFMAISAPRNNSESGRVYTYFRNEGSSTWVWSTSYGNPLGSKGFGYDMYLDEDGSKLAIGHVYSSDPGAVSIYNVNVSNGTLTNYSYYLPPYELTYTSRFGIFVALCDEFLFVCATSYSVPVQDYDSYPCYVYRYTNGYYQRIQTISSRQWANTSYLGGLSARRDTSGNVVLALGHRADNTFGYEAGSARLYVWDAVSAQFVLSKALYPPDVGSNSRQYMGWSVALGTGCRRVLVGLPEWQPSGYSFRQGRALVYAGTSDTVVTNTVTQNSLWVVSGSDMYFSGGFVGIGTTSPTVALDVAGTVKASSFVGNVPWTSVTGFSLPTHSHVITDVSGLSTELSGKANVGHTHTFGDITGAIELSQIPGWSSGWVAGRNLLYDGTKLITSENTTGNIFVGNKFVCVEPGSGAMLEKTLGGNDNRFGISQGSGATRVYSGSAFTGQSVRLGFSTGADAYDDVLVVEQGSVSAPTYKVSVADPGAMLERNYGSNDDRYGIAQDPGGILRMYGASGFATSSVRLGFAEPSGYNDVVTVDQTKTTVVGLLEGTGDIHAGLGVKYSELIVSGSAGNGCPVYFTGSNDWDITTTIGQSFFVTHNFGTTNYMVSCEVLYNGTSPTDGCDTWRPVVYVFNKQANSCAVRLILAGSGTAPTGKLSVGVLCTKLFVL